MISILFSVIEYEESVVFISFIPSPKVLIIPFALLLSVDRMMVFSSFVICNPVEKSNPFHLASIEVCSLEILVI